MLEICKLLFLTKKIDLSKINWFTKIIFKHFIFWHVCFEENGVSILSLHHGIVATSIKRKREDQNGIMTKIFNFCGRLISFFSTNASDGVKTTIHCAVSRDIPSQSGLYLGL